VSARVEEFDWSAISAALDDVGVSLTPPLLSPEECHTLLALYDDDSRFRSTIDMGRRRFGEGQYRYFSNPLPELVVELRAVFWPRLLPIAREWTARRGHTAPWPDDFGEWIEQCHAAGQTRPTPLMLRYEAGDWNALHRDLYGDLVFPLQVAISLSQPREDFTGGEFIVVEQRLRAQSRATAIEIPLGHALVFTTRDRPIKTQRGWSNAPMRHGVSTVRSGLRLTLGLIFHDAT
jgi:hypothetical protein